MALTLPLLCIWTIPSFDALHGELLACKRVKRCKFLLAQNWCFAAANKEDAIKALLVNGRGELVRITATEDPDTFDIELLLRIGR